MTLSDQALEIIWQLLRDADTKPDIKGSLLQKLAEHPRDAARALLEHLRDLPGRTVQDPALEAEGAA